MNDRRPPITVRIHFSPSQTSPQPGPVRETTAMLSDEEIVRGLKAVRHSCQTERLAKRIPSMKALAASIGVSREYLYQVLRGERELTFNLRAKLSEFLSCEQIDCERRVARRD